MFTNDKPVDEVNPLPVIVVNVDPVVITVEPTVEVSNFPATQPVSLVYTDNAPLPTKTIGGSGARAEIDQYYGAAVQLTAAHYKTHLGELFVATHTSLNVANNASVILRVKTGANVTHLHFEAASTGDSLITMNEGRTILTAGSAVTVVNKNRLSDNTALTTVFQGTTVSGGTELVQNLNPGGQRNSSTGGTGMDFEEFILLPDTEYTIEVQNVSGQSASIGIVVTFYEA